MRGQEHISKVEGLLIATLRPCVMAHDLLALYFVPSGYKIWIFILIEKVY